MVRVRKGKPFTLCGVFYLVLGLVYGGRQVLLGVGHGSDLIELVNGGVVG